MIVAACSSCFIIAYLIWKGSYNYSPQAKYRIGNYSISDLERKL